LIIYSTVASVLTVLGCLPEAFVNPGGHWVMAAMIPARIASVWSEGTADTIGILLVVMLFAAADLGALALGEDAKRREMDFLLTRPRPRKYFVWTSWLAGLTQLLPLLAVPALTSILVMLGMTHALQAGILIRTSLVILAMAAGVYALVFLFSTLSETAQNGLQIAGFVVFLYGGLNYARNEAWFNPDYHSKFWGAFDWFETSHQLFPSANLLILLCVTLALPLLVQAAFKRRDL
jgi:ABC-type transport system involved in multi-copper enzyme maturation permease subunit